MKTLSSLVLLGAVSLLVSCASIGGSSADLPTKGLAAERLRCEYLTDPLGIAVAQPRLSWIVRSAERGQSQSAYHVLVASTPELLAADKGDLWDSGRVASDETTAVVYSGRPLVSHQRAYWKVRVYDRDGAASPWSRQASWSMGFMDPAEWRAAWIGCDALRQVELADAPFDGAKWIWFAGDPGNAPRGHRVFMATLNLPADAKIAKAELIATADDKLWLNLNGQQVIGPNNEQDAWRRPVKVDVTPQVKPGANAIRAQVENAIESPAGLLAKLIVSTQDGKTIAFVTDESWRSTDKPGANWHAREIAADEWPACKVVGEYGVQPWGKLKFAELVLPPAVYLRKQFAADKPVKQATLYSTALGIHDMHLNGRRVSDDWFNPGWTDYTKRVYYRAYDVTGQIRPGANVMGAILADGWYAGYVGYGRMREHYGKKTRLSTILRIEYADGSVQTIVTGPDWKASVGPIRYSDFLQGEEYDANLAMPGWDQAGFDDGGWNAVDLGAELSPLVQPHPGPAVVVFAEVRPVKITEPSKGAYVYDMGQNFAGVVRLKIKGKPGQKITLRFAERLNPDGTIYTTNLRSARCTDTYICKGDGVETWTPRFTFHGFQYVELSGVGSAPSLETITGLALSSDTKFAGRFECSEPMLNKLHSNIRWTQRMNFIDIPTDCPQRDERLGWTGDAQVYIRTATLNADVQAFFTKWLVDLEDGQRADGQFPMVAPVKVAGDDGGPAWAEAGVICPWTIYEVYGDRRLLAARYPSMRRYIDFCVKRSTPELLPPKQYHCFGDWLSINADTPKDVIYTAYFAYATKLTAKAAEVLGRPEDASIYHALFERIKAAFNRAYVAEDGRIQGDTQTCYVLALAVDLLDEAKAKLAARHLVENIEARGNHLSTGFIGTKDLMLVLAKIGRHDVAYRLIHNETFPSWGFSIKHGATSIWERWDGWTPEKGFQDPGMNSFAHYSFGAVYQWMVENIAGIRNAAPAYKAITIAPQPGGNLKWARVSYDSIRGPIVSDWALNGDRLTLDVEIPANTTATVVIPATDASKVTESGRALDKAPGVKPVRSEAGVVVVSVGSGRYRFVSTVTPSSAK